MPEARDRDPSASRCRGQARRLIVSADDFGMSAGVNAAVIQAHRRGMLTQVSLMVNGAAAGEAIEMARSAPGLGIGLHLVLAQGRATLPPGRIPDLVDGDGFFRTHAVRAAFGYFFTPGVREQLRREVAAQLEKFLASGLPLSHVDGHMHVHMHPTVLDVLLALAEEFGIRAMRLTRDPLLLALQLDHRHAGRKIAEGFIFGILASYARMRMKGRGIHHTDRVFGLHQTGHVTEPYLLRLLPRLGPGVTELYCHPASLDSEARRWRPASYEGEAELAATTSVRVAGLLPSLGIEPISYRDLANCA